MFLCSVAPRSAFSLLFRCKGPKQEWLLLAVGKLLQVVHTTARAGDASLAARLMKRNVLSPAVEVHPTGTMYHESSCPCSSIGQIDVLEFEATLEFCPVYLGHRKASMCRVFASRAIAEDRLLCSASLARSMHHVGAVHNFFHGMTRRTVEEYRLVYHSPRKDNSLH